MFMIGFKMVLSLNYVYDVYDWDKVGFISTKMVVHILEMVGLGPFFEYFS